MQFIHCLAAFLLQSFLIDAQLVNWWNKFFSQSPGYVTPRTPQSDDLTDLIRCRYSIECPASVDPELMCVGSSWFNQMGYCLKPIDPTEYGCRMDEQCRINDYNSFCADALNQAGKRQCQCKPTFFFDPNTKKCVQQSQGVKTPLKQVVPEAVIPKSAETSKDELSTLTRCFGSQDCFNINITLSCVGASIGKAGYCLQPLKPMEYGCLLDDQCTKACPTSHCSTDPRFLNANGQRQCRCNTERYYMFHKCWQRCLEDISEPAVLNDGTRICREKTSTEVPDVETYMRRFKRQIQSSRVIC